MEIISQVEIDLLTGETRVLQTDIIYDCGQSLNPAVDLGQVCVHVGLRHTIESACFVTKFENSLVNHTIVSCRLKDLLYRV